MNWPQLPLRVLLQEAGSGTWGREPDPAEDVFPVLRSTNIQDGRLILENAALRSVLAKTAKEYALREGDILVTTSSGSPRLLGKNAILETLPDDRRTYLFSNFTWRLRSTPSIVLPKYLFFYLNSLPARATLQRLQNTTSGLRNLNTKLYLEQSVPLPPISEQRRIVEILDQADRLRRLRAEADAKAERFPDALFRKMFTEAASGAERLTSVPLGEMTREFRYGTSTMCFREPSGLPVLRIPNIVGGELALSDLKYASLPLEEVQRLRLEIGDILCVRTNGNPDYVGRCAVFDLKESYLFASYLIRARLDMSRADPWYVGSFMRSRDGRQAMSPYIRTTAGQSNISVGGLSQIPVPLPPIAEQQRFRARLAAAHGVLRDMKHAAGLLSRTFESLLRRAFTGDLSASWREAHMKELVEEMEQQAKTLAEVR